eukprot:6529750-Prymnesium_polylepis.1
MTSIFGRNTSTCRCGRPAVPSLLSRAPKCAVARVCPQAGWWHEAQNICMLPRVWLMNRVCTATKQWNSTDSDVRESR